MCLLSHVFIVLSNLSGHWNTTAIKMDLHGAMKHIASLRSFPIAHRPIVNWQVEVHPNFARTMWSQTGTVFKRCTTIRRRPTQVAILLDEFFRCTMKISYVNITAKIVIAVVVLGRNRSGCRTTSWMSTGKDASFAWWPSANAYRYKSIKKSSYLLELYRQGITLFESERERESKRSSLDAVENTCHRC